MTIRDRSAPLLLVKLETQDGEFRVVTDSVQSFRYTDKERQADVLKLTVDNSDLTQFDDPVWRKGGKLRVQWGYPGGMSPERTVVITSVKGFRQLSIEANALSVVMNRIVKCRVFENKTISDVVRDIASENGFGSDLQIIDEISEVQEVITQARLTDAQFLRRWASRVGFEFWVDFDGLHFHERRMGEVPVRIITYHEDPGQGDIIGEPTIENDLTARPGRVRVRGRDPMTREDIDQTADNDSDGDRPTAAPIIEIIDPDTGNTTTVEQTLASEDTVPTADATPAAARRRARGRFRRTQQVAVKMSLPIVGDPLLLAKTVVEIRGMGQRLSIRYYTKEVDHNLSTGGYSCKLKLISDGHGGHSTRSMRAQGLSLVQAGRGPGRGRGSSRQVGQQIEAALAAARANGDTQSVAMLETAEADYARDANASRASVTRVLAAVARNPNADAATRRASSQAAGSLAQRGPETEAGGRPNTGEARPDTAELQPVDVIDEDTGRATTVYREERGRGTEEREATT